MYSVRCLQKVIVRKRQSISVHEYLYEYVVCLRSFKFKLILDKTKRERERGLLFLLHLNCYEKNIRSRICEKFNFFK